MDGGRNPGGAAGATGDLQDHARAVERLCAKIELEFPKLAAAEDLPPTLLLGGPIRCGKSTLAARIAAATGRVWISCDRIAPIYRDFPDLGQRIALKRFAMLRLLHRFPRGLVLEGAQLAHLIERAPGRTELDLRLMWEVAQAFGLPAHVLVNGEDDVEAIVAGLERYRQTGKCWTRRRHSPERLVRLAGSIKQQSQNLRREADRFALPVHTVLSSAFEASVAAAFGEIVGADQPVAAS